MGEFSQPLSTNENYCQPLAALQNMNSATNPKPSTWHPSTFHIPPEALNFKFLFTHQNSKKKKFENAETDRLTLSNLRTVRFSS